MTNRLGIFGIAALLVAVGCGGGGGKNGGGAKSPDGNGSSSESGGSGDGNEGGSEGGGEPAAEAKFAAPAPGAKMLEQRSASLEFELTLTRDKAAGGMQAGKWSLDEERSLEVLSSKGAAVTGMKVIYGKREAKPLLGVEMTAATAAHTYTIDAKGGSANIARKDGDITNDEKDALMAEFDWLGGPSPLMRWVQGGELASGKTVNGGGPEARALLGVLQGYDYSSAKVSATSKGKGQSGGREMLDIDVTANIRLTSGQTHFDLELKGPAKIDLKTGWVAELSLAGPLKASGKLKHKKGDLDVSGKGTSTLKRTSKF